MIRQPQILIILKGDARCLLDKKNYPKPIRIVIWTPFGVCLIIGSSTSPLIIARDKLKPNCNGKEESVVAMMTLQSLLPGEVNNRDGVKEEALTFFINKVASTINRLQV